MNKIGPGGVAVLHEIDERGRVDHPAAIPHSTRVWRIVRGSTTIAWLRFLPPRAEPWAVYFDGTDTGGRQAWARSFATSTSAVAWTVQHAAELTRRRRRLGPSLIR